MKTRLNKETDAHQVSATPSADAHTTEAAGFKAASPKDRILALAQDQNLSEGFGAVLHQVALLDSGTDPLTPNSEDEQLSWEGYRRGLISGLLCVAMHERRCAPRAAALLVGSLLDQAREAFRTVRPENEA